MSAACQEDIVSTLLASTIKSIYWLRLPWSDYILCKCPHGAHLPELLVRGRVFVFPDCEPNDSKSFLQTQRKQDAEKDPSQMQAHSAAKVLNLFIYLIIFSAVI